MSLWDDDVPDVPPSIVCHGRTHKYYFTYISGVDVRLIQILTYVFKENRVVVGPTLILIAMLLWYAGDAGFAKLDVTPGSGFDAGIKIVVGVAISSKIVEQ